jgi:hypothetical protein
VDGRRDADVTAPAAASERIWVTSDGRFVRDGHPDAAVLAAAEGDPVPAGFDGFDEPEARKPSRKPAAKPEAGHAEKPES